MNFSDLLDEDDQGTRELDAWLAENIANEDVEWDDYWECYKTGDVIVTEAHPVYVKPFTTGDSIDPIWELAKNQGFPIIEPAIGGWKAGISKISGEVLKDENVSLGKSKAHHDEKIAIAEALFKAHQKENAITTEEAVEKYDDPENSFPPKGDE